jgi:hypothetical protein
MVAWLMISYSNGVMLYENLPQILGKLMSGFLDCEPSSLTEVSRYFVLDGKVFSKLIVILNYFISLSFEIMKERAGAGILVITIVRTIAPLKEV